MKGLWDGCWKTGFVAILACLSLHLIPLCLATVNSKMYLKRFISRGLLLTDLDHEIFPIVINLAQTLQHHTTDDGISNYPLCASRPSARHQLRVLSVEARKKHIFLFSFEKDLEIIGESRQLYCLWNMV